MLPFSEDNLSEVIEAFSSTFRYLDDRLNIDNNFFDSKFDHFYPSELQFKKGQRDRYQGLIFGFTFIYTGWFAKTKR